jgi:hypothetical protein
LRNKYAWVTEGNLPPPSEVTGFVTEDKTLQVSFVLPSKKPEFL